MEVFSLFLLQSKTEISTKSGDKDIKNEVNRKQNLE